MNITITILTVSKPEFDPVIRTQYKTRILYYHSSYIVYENFRTATDSEVENSTNMRHSTAENTTLYVREVIYTSCFSSFIGIVSFAQTCAKVMVQRKENHKSVHC